MNRLTNLLNLNYQPFNFWNSWYFLRILLKFLNGSHQQRSWIENLNALITVKKFNHDLHLFISHINPTISSLHCVKLITSSLMNNQLQLQSPRPWYPQTFQLEHRSANSVTDHSWNTGSWNKNKFYEARVNLPYAGTVQLKLHCSISWLSYTVNNSQGTYTEPCSSWIF